MAIFNSSSRTLTGNEEIEPERVLGAHSSFNLFDVLGVKPVRGRVHRRRGQGRSELGRHSFRTASGSAASAATTMRSGKRCR
jgi:hypothetical protein